MPRGWRRRKAQRGRAGPRRRCVPPPPGDSKGFESNVFGNPEGRITLRPFGFSSFSSRSTTSGASHQKGPTEPSLPLLVASRATAANLSRAPSASLARQSKGLPDRDQDRPSVFHHRDRQAQPPITFDHPAYGPLQGPLGLPAFRGGSGWCHHGSLFNCRAIRS